MDKMYYETINKLETMGIKRDYIQGWIGGYLKNPKREEQRLSEAYEVGYKDGSAQEINNAERFKN